MSLLCGVVLVPFSFLLLKSASRIRMAGVGERKGRGKLKGMAVISLLVFAI